MNKNDFELLVEGIKSEREIGDYKRNFSLAICNNNLVAYSYDRLNREDIGDFVLYKYEIQSSDDGFDPESLRLNVLTNHWGTLISSVPLLSDSNERIYLDNDNFIEFPHILVSEEEYIKCFNLLDNNKIKDIILGNFGSSVELER